MLLWFFIITLVLFIIFLFTNRIHIDWKSLFKRGFSKKDEHFGLYCYTGKQRKR